VTKVTRPYLPPLEELLPDIEEMWSSGILSNGGPFHNRLEAALAEYLGLPYVSLFCNATIGLITAQQALNITGEVITTPYSFVATSHALHWMGNRPVFVDVEADSLTLDPARIEEAITPETSAIMPVHCYGNTCNVEDIRRVADRHNLRVIYDACHSFGVFDETGSVLRHGDLAVVSFHATKVFTTLEGGLVVSPDAETKRKVDHLKNFGFVDETTVIEPGINGKMPEFNAAVGLAQLRHFDEVLSRRSAIDALYRQRLASVEGIRCQDPVRQPVRNYAYFPVFVENGYPLSRDQLYEQLQRHDIFGRRYFYPLISEFAMYRHLPSASAANLPVATAASRRVICLPLYPELEHSEVHRICELIASAGR